MDPWIAGARNTCIAYAGGSIYWAAGCGGDFQPTRSAVSSANASGVVTQHYWPPDCQPDSVASASIALDDNTIYWLTRDGHVVSLARSAAVGTVPTRLATTNPVPVGGWPLMNYVAVLGDHVYWTDATTLYSVGRTGGAPTAVVSIPGHNLTEVLPLAPGHVVVRSDQAVSVVAVTGVPGVAWSSRAHVVALAAAGDAFAWAEASADGSGTRVFGSSAVHLGRTTLLHTAPTLGHDTRPTVDALALDANNVYVHEIRDALSGGPVLRAPLAGGDAEPITPYLAANQVLTLGGSFLWWTDFADIYRVSTTAAPTRPPGGITIVGIEITQGVQTSTGQVPLLAGRRTFVRAYVSATDDDAGPWTGVSARLSSSASGTIHSPINSYAITVAPAGSDRRTLDDSFLFELNPEETETGTVDLAVQVFPPAGRPHLGGAPMGATARFQARADGSYVHEGFYHIRSNYTDVPADVQSQWGVPNPPADELLAGSWVARPLSDLQDGIRAAQGALPLAYLIGVPWPGASVRDETWVGGDTYANARTWMYQQSDLIHSEDPIRKMVLLQPEVDVEHWHGLTDSGTRVNYSQTIDSSAGTPVFDHGATLAHELGHTFGLCHSENVGSGNGCFDASYPRAGGAYGPEVGIALEDDGTGVWGPVVVPGTDAAEHSTISDLMAYSNRYPLPTQWTSPYMYCKALNNASHGDIDARVDGFSG